VSRDHPEITFLGVAGLDSDSAYENFVNEHGLGHFTHAIDPDRSLFGHFGSSTQDAWFFVLEDGSVHAETRYGEMSEDQLRAFIEDLSAA
jgi:hypothetical protein